MNTSLIFNFTTNSLFNNDTNFACKLWLDSFTSKIDVCSMQFPGQDKKDAYCGVQC